MTTWLIVRSLFDVAWFLCVVLLGTAAVAFSGGAVNPRTAAPGRQMKFVVGATIYVVGWAIFRVVST